MTVPLQLCESKCCSILCKYLHEIIDPTAFFTIKLEFTEIQDEIYFILK